MNILLDSECPACEHTAVLELKVMTEMYDPQQLLIKLKCHFCNVDFSKLVGLNEMEVCGE